MQPFLSQVDFRAFLVDYIIKYCKECTCHGLQRALCSVLRRDFLLFLRFATFHMDRSIFYPPLSYWVIMKEQPFGYTNQEYADMLIVFGACDQVGRRAAVEYQRRFPNRRHPDAGTFERVYQRVTETGNVHVRNPDGGRSYTRFLRRRSNNELASDSSSPWHVVFNVPTCHEGGSTTSLQIPTCSRNT